MNLDRKDQKILEIVQSNNLTPHREIADRVGLSTAAVTRRLGRLRKQGYIKADVSVLNQKLLNRSLVIISQVVADSEKLEERDAMRDAFMRCPQIQQCHYVTGEADFILIFNVADMGEYESLTRELFFSSGNVKRFTTFVSMETVKSGQHVVIKPGN